MTKPLLLLCGLALFVLALPGPRADEPKKLHIVFVTGDCEYRSEITMPLIAKILEAKHGMKCTVCYAEDEKGARKPKYLKNIKGLEALKTADLAVFYMRYRALPDDQLKLITDYIKSGKPAVGLRTSTHAFAYPGKSPHAKLNNDFGRNVFGQRWISHHGHNSSTNVTVIAKDHPITRGVAPTFHCRSWLYNVTPLVGNCTPLLRGEAVKGDKPDKKTFGSVNPVAWTKVEKGQRVFFTTLGHPKDFEVESVRRLLINGIYWALGQEAKIPPGGSNAELQGKYVAPPTTQAIPHPYDPPVRTVAAPKGEAIMNTARINRRQALGAAAAVALAGAAPGDKVDGPIAKNKRIKQSLVYWCYQKHWSLAQMCAQAKRLGCSSIELVDPKMWPTLKKHGLICAIASSHGFEKGMNNPAHHAMCLDRMRTAIDACAEAGFPSVITFTGFRAGLADDVGAKNCVAGYKKIVGHAEKKKVTLCLEMLNSKVAEEMKGHPDYQGDHLDYCADIVKAVGSPSLKLLFDIYHVQIMDGDVIRRLRKHAALIGHVHTAGVPGRGELDDKQEVHYRPIMQALVAVKYQGYVGQEFIPTRDPAVGLREAVALCDV